MQELENLQLDPERKHKVIQIARHLKKSCYQLHVAKQKDEWLVVCTSKIDGVIYESANAIDAFEAKDHADIFKFAFSKALDEHEEKKKKPTIIMN